MTDHSSGKRTPWHAIDRTLALTRTLGAVLASLALAAIVVSYSFEVVSRYVFSAPTWWSAELVSYLLCIMTFTMMPYVTATRGHVAVTILVDALPDTLRGGATRTLALIGALACAAMTVQFNTVSRRGLGSIAGGSVRPGHAISLTSRLCRTRACASLAVCPRSTPALPCV